ncbi:MAG: UDP-forming cellulose synthase catalytic subunit [Halothiobacillaceae bacterium]
MDIHSAKETALTLLQQHGILAWLVLVFGFIWLAHLPLTVEAQAALAATMVAILWLIMKSMDRLEVHQARQIKFLRLLAIFLAAFVSLRYFSWRINYTISYHDPFSLLGAFLLLGAELYGLTIYLIGAFVNAWPIHRNPPKLPDDPSALPTVDILIPTYNEDPELLELTLLAATQVDYPKERFKVYLCDDGGTVQRRNRPDISAQAWERYHTLNALCERVGAIYVTREKNLHAKAGNINSALQDHCRGDLVLILDADHIPARDILKNTVGFFLRDPKLFLVQTPHYFINPDPLERNLRTYEQMPSENEMFYSLIQHGLDFWNASFFCGSAALLRRKYLDQIGGIAGETITEDAETAMTLHGLGYNSVYYGKPMIAGLQPETFSGFIVQRSRWAQGMVQIFLLKNPWTQPQMTLTQRIAYTSSVFFWFFPFARMVFFIAPSLYLLFSLKIVDAFLPWDLIAYALPHVLAAMMLSNILYGRTRWPLISELYETIQSVHALPAIINVIRAPRSPSFAVTPKGERLEENFISQLALPFYLMLLLDIVCLIAGVIRLYVVPEDIGVITLTMALTGLNMIFSLAAIGVMLEKSQRRAAYRIPVQIANLPAWLHHDNKRFPVVLDDISHAGAGLLTSYAVARNEKVTLEVAIPAWDNALVRIPARLVRRRYNLGKRWDTGLMFEPKSMEEKRAIIALVYGDSDLHLANQRRRQRRISLLEGLMFLIKTAFSHAWENFTFLTQLFFARLVRWVKGLLPTSSSSPSPTS